MDCVDGALKSSLTSQGVCDNMYCSPVDDNVAVSAEDFFVDDLLDFSKAEVEDVYTTHEDKAFVIGGKIEDETVHLSPLNAPPVTVHETELSIPADELADLEWLSNFVDDSTPGYSLTLPAEKLPVNTAGMFNCTEEKCSVTATKARSRRARNGVRVWPLSESSYSSSSSSYTSSSSPFSQSAESLIGKVLAKKQKQQHSTDTAGGGGAQPRRCSHCLVQKTPQWRAGPLGAKTLCNACGVRYKSGRLLPEYRPACSPTFSSEKHSNNHRKVMEMRRKKEGDGGFATPVESF